MNIETAAVHAGRRVDPTTGSILPPIYQTATYTLEEIGIDKGFDYSRSSNPTRSALEENLAALEGARHAVAFSSGMSAVDAVLRLFSAGDHIIAGDDVYGGVSRLFNQVASRSKIAVDYVDTSNPAAITAAIRPETKLIWIETPSNPLLKITDVAEVARIAKHSNILLGVDSTFATPYLLQPLALGADLVVHSTTKYLSGHNQVIGGACLTNDAALHEELKFLQKSVGAVPSPFDCWLTLLGIKTLALRMERHCRNAQAIARFLSAHPALKSVRYPGLPSHPQHELASRQQRGFGGIITFELHGGFDAGVALLAGLRVISLAESLGAVESMITHPASMTHKCIPRAERLERGISDGLIRLSVGIEALDDLLEDLRAALDHVAAGIGIEGGRHEHHA